MNNDIPELASYSELQARERFHVSLAFHPTEERRFESVLAPYVFPDKAPCGIASCHTPHLMGYLISTSDGLETNIGKDCGRKYFGKVFAKDRKRVEDAITRRRRIDSILVLQAQLPSMLDELAVIGRDYQQLKEHKQRLLGAIGEALFSHLKTRALRGEPAIVKYVPMTKAEADAHFATTNRRPGESREWPQKEVLKATLEGLLFMRARFQDMIITDLIQPIERIKKLTTEEISSMKSRQLASDAKWVGEVPVKIVRAKEVIDAGWRFFTAENLARLVHLGAPIGALESMMADLAAGPSQQRACLHSDAWGGSKIKP